MDDIDEQKEDFRAFADTLLLSVELLEEPSRSQIAMFVLNFQQGWWFHALGSPLSKAPLNPNHPVHKEVPGHALRAFEQGFNARGEWIALGRPTAKTKS